MKTYEKNNLARGLSVALPHSFFILSDLHSTHATHNAFSQHVQTPFSQHVYLRVSPQMKTEDVKHMIEEKYGIPSIQQRLTTGTGFSDLRDGTSLSSQKVDGKYRIHLRLRGNPHLNL